MRVLITITIVVAAGLMVAALPAGKEDPKTAPLAKRNPAAPAQKPGAPATVAKRSAPAPATAPKPALATAKRATAGATAAKAGSAKVSKRHSKSKGASPVKRSANLGRAFSDPAAEYAQAKALGLARAKRLAKQ